MNKNLTDLDFDIIRQVYNTTESREEAQRILSERYDVVPRTIRRWVREMNFGKTTTIGSNVKILIYDIETSRIEFTGWWTGKQYVGSDQIKKEASIISISYKWLGEDTIYALHWDNNHSDEIMIKKFVEIYNQADMVIGMNNDNFDNRWVNAKIAKYGLELNVFIRSFDLIKKAKSKFRLPSYSMKFMAQYFGVPQKLEHEGIKMWEKIEYGTPEEQEEYLNKMLIYNNGDIITTEALYYRLRKYFGHNTHVGVLMGEEKYTCPVCGSSHIDLYKTTVTPAGTVQRIMICKEDNVQYKITNRQYILYLKDFVKNI